MNIVVLSFDQLTFLLKLLNPDADIRKIDARFNHGENILFSKITGDKLIIPFGYRYTTKEGITNKHNNEKYYTTCKIYSHTKAEKMGVLLEESGERKKKKPEIKKAYIYKDENNERAVCVCYDYGYKIAHKDEFMDLMYEFGKQRNIKALKDILENKDVIKRVPKETINKIITSPIPFDIDNYFKMNNSYINLKPKSAHLLKNGYLIVKSRTLLGKGKKTNTDSSLVISHPKDKNIELLAVADSEESQSIIIPSATATDELKQWFNNLDLDELEKEEEVGTKLKEKIYNINCILYNIGYRNNAPNSTTTSLTIAMVLRNNTIIASVGSSKAYILKDGNLSSLTSEGQTSTTKLGESSPYNLYITNIKNNSYDKLLLLTDGITHSLNDGTIKLIANTTNKNDIVNELVDSAIGNYDDKEYGNDNATVAVYIKK